MQGQRAKRHSPDFLLALAAGLFLLGSCTNSSDSASKKDSGQLKTSAPAAASDSATQVAELNFLDGCVDNAKAGLGEAKAYVYCKCLMQQIKQKYGKVDSTTTAALQTDTAAVANMARQCK